MLNLVPSALEIEARCSTLFNDGNATAAAARLSRVMAFMAKSIGCFGLNVVKSKYGEDGVFIKMNVDYNFPT